MARVFISHAVHDGKLAGELHRWLSEDGHEVFRAQDLNEGISVGEAWEHRIHERLRWADAVVCVVTSAYVASRWAMAEIGIAMSRGSRLLPVLAESGVRHPLMSSIQYADMTTDAVVARQQLLETLRRVDAAGGRGWPDDKSPYPGLGPFDADQRQVFFGRNTEVEELAATLRSQVGHAEGVALLVVGPPGCGKSSLVRAGLVPVIAEEPAWLTLQPVVPGVDPVAALSRVLVGAGRLLDLSWTTASVRRVLEEGGLTKLADELLLAAPGHRQRLLIVVDQIEELLTATGPEDRAWFGQLLRQALLGPVCVVATLRSEFFDTFVEVPELAALPTQAYPLKPLQREALAAVIEGPAKVAGINVDQDLVARLVADTRFGESLPLLAFTLAQLAYEIPRGGWLSLERYERLGGVPGAVARQADGALADAIAVSGRTREQVIAGLLQLVTFNEHGRPTALRVVRDKLSDLVAAELNAFVERRLMSIDTRNDAVVVGFTHEAVLYAWPPLAAAIARVHQHSGLISDLESAEDSLDVADDVWNIARMIAALKTTPPLSIALLGDWGSGKSSFMRQVIGRVHSLAAASQADPRGSAYAANVRQVRFNAWHYSDDHLWVGLVEHLFRELASRGHDPNDSQRDDVQAELITAQARHRRLSEDLNAVDSVAVDSGWLGWLQHPFRVTRVLKGVSKSIRDEIRSPKRLLVGLSIILLGALLAIGFVWLGQALIGWVTGAIAIVGGLVSPVVLTWRHIEKFTNEARKKLGKERVESENEIRSLEARLDLIDPARRLEHLLSEISSTDRYERYRGLTGRIRHDLDRLSDDLSAAQRKWATGADVPLPLQRVILYVDDLDRCSASRVVEVLQAVNLLLSMPLFVVVVAVDPRWLLLALEQHHGHILSDARRIRSLDYLDKIFQIPYAVKPMGERGADYLRSLLPPGEDSEGEEESAAEDLNPASGGQRPSTPRDASADQSREEVGPLSPSVGGADDSASGETGDGAAGHEVFNGAHSSGMDLTGRGLRLWETERTFLPYVAPLLPTPRAVKRFTNLYRLLRIGVPEVKLTDFIGGDEGGPYQAAALLLAAIVSAPTQAESLLLALGSASHGEGTDVVDVLMNLDNLPVAKLLAEHIGVIRKALPVHGAVTTYRASAAAVARYSFETYHLFVS